MTNDIEKLRPRVFLAEVDGETWWEKTIDPATNEIVDHSSGRHSDAAGDFDALTPAPKVMAMIAYDTPTGMRYAQIAHLVRPCNLAMTSGTGDGTAPASYVYTITDAIDAAITFVEVSPEHNRLASKTTAATKGFYWVDNSVSPAEPHLVITDEIPDGVTEEIKIVTNVSVDGTTLKRTVRSLKFAGGVLYDSGSEADEIIDEGETCA